MSDMGTIQNQIVSRDKKNTRQSNSYNQLLTKRHKCERGLQHAQNPSNTGLHITPKRAPGEGRISRKNPLSFYELFQKIEHSAFAYYAFCNEPKCLCPNSQHRDTRYQLHKIQIC